MAEREQLPSAPARSVAGTCPDCGESIEVGIYGGSTDRSYDSCWNWECDAYHKFSRDRSAETYADEQSTESETTQTKLVTDGGESR